jgi:hypothetical protein
MNPISTAPRGSLIGSVLVLASSAAAAAADTELVTRDLFVSLDSQPTDFTYTASGPLGSRSGSDAFKSDLGVSLGGRWSFTVPGSSFGLVAGIDLDATDYLYQDSAKNFTYGARAVVGAGWQATDDWQLLLEPTAEYGLATFNFPSSVAAPAYEAKGTYFGYGVRVAAVYSVTRSFSLLGTVGYKRIDDKLSGDGIDLTLKQSGVAFSLGLLWRFSSAPARIE